MGGHEMYALAPNGNGSLPAIEASNAQLVEARRWLRQRINSRSLVGEVVMLTPALATIIMDEHNFRNRPLRQARGVEWAERIARGEWMLMSQGISFATDFALNNGQHRCLGVIKSGIAVPVFMFFGEDPKAFHTLDSNMRPRSGGDTLAVAGQLNAQAVAAIARVLMAVGSTQQRTTVRIPHSALLAFVAAHPDLGEAVSSGQRFVAAMPKTSGAGASAGWYLIRRAGADAAKLEPFWEILLTGVGIRSVRDPINQLRKGVIEGRLAHTKSIRGHYIAASVILAWNLWSTGRMANGMPAVTWAEDVAFPTPHSVR